MKDSNLGIIRSVRGTLVDILFPQRMPDISSRLVTGENAAIEIAVINHPSAYVGRTPR